MRVRKSLTAVVGAVAVFAALPASSASAASGEFLYKYVGLNSVNLNGALNDPESGVCINIPETVGHELPALAPQNLTN
ncbi:hypothetical protein, partial [Streptomyces sp. NPDC059389]|uniref:hypothetical protein n=1 Tax=Streptomyces sp. NPDC059389 TaxID=3346818 RepID=UPI003697D27B